MIDVQSKASPIHNAIDFKQSKMRGISDQSELDDGLGHKNELFSCDRKGWEDSAHSQAKQFSHTCATDWENLSRTCSSMSQMSEAAKLLLQEKDKQVKELKERVNRLEEKLETKDCELIQLRSQVGGLEVQGLQIKLTEATVRLDERDKQLMEWKIIADGLIKNNASFDEFKQQMKNISAQASARPSHDQSASCSQDGQEQHNQSTENQEYELKEAYCCYCDHTTSKLIDDHYQECNIRERFDRVVGKYGKHWKSKLFDFEKEPDKHITLFPHYNQMFTEFKSNLYEDDMGALELFNKLQEDLQIDHQDVQMDFDTNRDIEEERKGSDIASICHLCGTKVVGSALKWDGTAVTGALMAHLNNDCSYISDYTTRVNEVAENWKQYLEQHRLNPYQDIRSFFSSCSKFFSVVASKVKHPLKYKGPAKEDKQIGVILDKEANNIDKLGSEISILEGDLYQGVSAFQDMMQPLFQYATVYSTTKDVKSNQLGSYYLLDPVLELTATGRRSYLTKDVDQWQNKAHVEQEQKLADLTRYWCPQCQRVFSCVQLWQQHRTPKCNCCDVFFDCKYDHSFGSALKFSLVSKAVCSKTGLTTRQLSMDEIKAAISEIKLLNAQHKVEKCKASKLSAEGKRTPLEQRRVDQEISIKAQFKLNKRDLLVVEDWLETLACRFKSSDPFIKVGYPICDAIILPLCPEVFGQNETHNAQMKAFLLSHYVPVVNVTYARKQGCVFVGLEDSRNAFTNDLLSHLKASMIDLVTKVKAAEGNWRNIYIRQIDYTQDLLGFFMSVNVLSDLKTLSEKLGIPYSRSISQLATCFQFTSTVMVGDLEVPETRIKLYNKWVHFLTSGQKKWISMDLKKLLEPNTAFFIDKILPTLKKGFSRLELSAYYHSQEQQQALFASMSSFEGNINKTLTALNDMPKLNYRMSLNQCIESYFKMIDTKSTLVSYDNDLHAIAYSYCKRSSRFSGHLVNTTNKSEQPINFLRRFGRSINRVFIHSEQFLVVKPGQLMQLPISSLNEKHRQISDGYSLDWAQFRCYLGDESLKIIKLACDDPEFYSIFGEDHNFQKQSFGQHFEEEQHIGWNIDLSGDFNVDRTGISNKRVTKHQGKITTRDSKREREEIKDKGIDVTNLAQLKKGKVKNHWLLSAPDYQQCKYFSVGGSQSKYLCEHCKRTLKRQGKSLWRLQL